MSSRNEQLGTKLGPRIARLVADAIIDVQRRSMPTKHKLVMHSFEAMSDQISAEVDVALQPALAKLLADEDLPGELRPWLEFLHSGHGQLKALAGSTLAQASILQPLAQIITNTLQPTVGRIIGVSPTGVPDPGTIAGIVAQGVDSRPGTQYAMRWQGLSDSWSNDLYEAAFSYPGLTEVLDLLNRGVISQAQADKWLIRNAIPNEALGPLLRLRETLLSPADAALAVLRGNMTNADGVKAAARNGVSSGDFNVLIGNTGEPPGLEQMLEGYRRGFIDESQLEKGIKESRVRDEWISFVKRLRFQPMSTADAVNAVVQGHLPLDRAAAIAEQNGLEPGQVDTLVANAGEPLAHEQMAELYNRGKVTLTQFKQAINESRLKDKYTDLAIDLHTRIPPPREVTTWLKDGAITKQQAMQYLSDYGYDHQAATAAIEAGTAQKVTTSKQLALSVITGLYEDRAITRTKATELLRLLKYDDAEAAFILELHDLKRVRAITSQGIAAVRGPYVARHINEGEASVLLDELGIPADERDQYLKVWAIERKAKVRTLSEAQIAKAVKLQLITPQAGVTRLEDLGYTEADAVLLIEGA